MRRLYEHGVWAIFSTLDPRVLQFKPGLLLTPDLCTELLDRVEVAIAEARKSTTRLAQPGGRPPAPLARGTTPGAPAPDRRSGGRTSARRAPSSRRAPAFSDEAGAASDDRARRARSRRADQHRSAHRPGGSAAGLGPCCSGPSVGRVRVRPLRPGRGGPDRPRGRPRRGAAKAREYADWAVRETGFGVAEHKVIKNLASSGRADRGLHGYHDYVTPGSIRPPAGRRSRARPGWCSRSPRRPTRSPPCSSSRCSPS